MTTRPMSASSPSRSAMLASTSAVQATIGAPAFTAASPVSMPTFSAPKTPHSAKNFSLTRALIGAVYQLRRPAASAAYWAPVATSDLPEPVGVARTTLAPLTSSISASSCAGYSVVPAASAHAEKRANSSSGSPPSARSAVRSVASSSRGGAIVAVIVRNSVPDAPGLPAPRPGFRPGAAGYAAAMSSPRPESQPAQQQTPPGTLGRMDPKPDHGEQSYRGSGRLAGKRAVITGGDSGIGRAVAIAFAREGADVLISYLDEHEDAKDTAKYVEEAGRKCVLVPGDLSDRAHAHTIVPKAVEELGGIDILVNNAAFQMTHESLDEISDEEWDHTVATNLTAMFVLCKDAVPHMRPGAAIINSSSVNSDMPSPTLAPYAMTKAGIANFTASLAQLLAEKGIRANSVAPGPVWTPLIPSTMPEEKVESFGEQVPMGRAAQPAELAPVYVMLASDEASYVSGARVAVTGGKPIL